MNLANVIDGALNDRAIVFGSLPPHGRDLDLLVRDHSLRAVTTALEKRGATNSGEEWALFTGCKVQSADVVPASDWRLTPGALAALFEDSLPLQKFNHIRKPAPRHVLLILARRRAFDEGSLRDKHKARIQQALLDDKAGWASARSEAESWRAIAALECLHREYQGRTPPDRLRARARGEILERSSARGWISLVPHPRRGTVVALSGLDGSGKTTQATHLHATLEQLGIEAVVEETRITAIPSFNDVTAPAKRPLAADEQSREPSGAVRQEPHEPRRANPLVDYVASCIVAIKDGMAHRRATARHLRNARVVICDGYALDSIVRLRALFGHASRFRLQTAIIKGLSPTPAAAYWLEVPSETSVARNADRYTAEDLRARSAVYRQLLEQLSVTRLDGTASVDALCELIARDCWPRL
ncbi:MAG: hypothetical protein M3290_08115 [Actinomycetota bacterium]|nr:hypothetical protein [Actinomycetota bacterium]